MSLTDFFFSGELGNLIGGGGDNNEATATASTDVEVNPNIDVINVIDFDGLVKIAEIVTEEQARTRAATVNSRDQLYEALRFAGAGAMLVFAMRK